MLVLVEYYFDIETTGFHFDKDEIITIQWQELDRYTGESVGALNILKRWEYENQDTAEREMIKEFIPKLELYNWDFIFIGKNLAFDFCMLDGRMRHYDLGKIDLEFLHRKIILDIKPILVMMNGAFKGYNKIIPNTNPTENREIPLLYKKKKYAEILQYIEDETKDFIKAYQILKKELPKLTKLLNPQCPDG